MIIFPLIFLTIITAQMLSSRDGGQVGLGPPNSTVAQVTTASLPVAQSVLSNYWIH